MQLHSFQGAGSSLCKRCEPHICGHEVLGNMHSCLMSAPCGPGKLEWVFFCVSPNNEKRIYTLVQSSGFLQVSHPVFSVFALGTLGVRFSS